MLGVRNHLINVIGVMHIGLHRSESCEADRSYPDWARWARKKIRRRWEDWLDEPEGSMSVKSSQVLSCDEVEMIRDGVVPNQDTKPTVCGRLEPDRTGARAPVE